MGVRTDLTPAVAARKKARKQELRAMAKDMGISVHKLAMGISIEKELMLANKSSRRTFGNESTKESRQKLVDRVAEKLPIHANENLRERDEMREWLDTLNAARHNDPAFKAANKIFRAIPRESDAIVITRPEWQVVTIARPEKALNQAAIERRLRKAQIVANSAVAKADEARKLADAKTVLKRTPKALKESAEKLAGLADVELGKVRKLAAQLRKAELQHVADGKVIIPVKDIRISLRPQSMANSVARALREIPDRTDVHPFRSEIRVRHNRQFSPHSYESQPERDYRRYVEMMERIAQLEAEKAQREEIREARIQAMWEQFEKDAELAREQKRIERAEKAKARMANNRANWDPAKKEAEKMRSRENRRKAKLNNR